MLPSGLRTEFSDVCPWRPTFQDSDYAGAAEAAVLIMEPEPVGDKAEGTVCALCSI